MSGKQFDPAEHTAAEVHDYLSGELDMDEHARVVQAEQARPGGPRVTALAGLVQAPPAQGEARTLRHVSGPALD